MFKRNLRLALVVSVVTTTLWAATDPFVGDWKFNPDKSQYLDVMKVANLGGNKYTFDFGGGPEQITLDGTDQQGIQGTMLSVSAEADGSWKVVRKKDDQMLLSAAWKLSPDGNALTDNFTQFGPNGSPSTEKLLYKRADTGTGFPGVWERMTPRDGMPPAFVLQVRSYEGNGLSFTRPGETRNLRFDGKDYPVEGVPKGSTTSARRVDERSLEITDKLDGKVRRTERRELSPDLKTLTRTIHPVGQREPNIFVYERQ